MGAFLMKVQHLFIVIVFCVVQRANAQELYVYSEPASNMPAYSLSPRLKVMVSARENRATFQRYTPELMFGVSKNLMIHGAATFANMHWNDVRWEGAYMYAKYRFISLDDVHKHFRMAAFAEGGYSRNPRHYDDISVRGDNNGIGGGLIATQLINKLAISGTAGYLKHFYDENDHSYHNPVKSAINYSLSAGYLVFPIEYESYDQLNFNVYAEFLGQQTFGKETWYIDFAPAVQFIIKSNARLNFGYRFQLDGNSNRSMRQSFLASLEYTFFNALNKKKK
jgi:hypothetical protein